MLLACIAKYVMYPTLSSMYVCICMYGVSYSVGYEKYIHTFFAHTHTHMGALTSSMATLLANL